MWLENEDKFRIFPRRGVGVRKLPVKGWWVGRENHELCLCNRVGLQGSFSHRGITTESHRVGGGRVDESLLWWWSGACLTVKGVTDTGMREQCQHTYSS